MTKSCMGFEKIIFDSNVWIGHFTSADPHHEAAKRLVEAQCDTEPLHITNEIISETATILKIRYNVSAAQLFISFIQNNPAIIRIPPVFYFDITLEKFKESKETELSFTDMSLVVLSKHFTVHTFDVALKKALTKH